MRRFKSLFRLCLSILAIVAMTAVVASTASAATAYYWSSGSPGNTGIWDTSSSFWGFFSGYWNATPWVDSTSGNLTTAVFQGTAGAVSIPSGEARTVSGVTFSVPTGGGSGYDISGGTLNLDNNTSATTITINTAAASVHTIDSVITGTKGLTLNSSGTTSNTLMLTGNNTYTGLTIISQGILEVTSNNALGDTAATNSVSFGFGNPSTTGLYLLSQTTNGSTLTVGKRISIAGKGFNSTGQVLAKYAAGYDNLYKLTGTISMNASNAGAIGAEGGTRLELSGPVDLSGASPAVIQSLTTRGFTLDGSGNIAVPSGTITISGNITGGTGSGGVTNPLVTGIGQRQAYTGTAYYGLGNYVLSGNNTYSGSTTVGYDAFNFATWTIKSSTALGAATNAYTGSITAGTFVYNNSALQLDGNGGAISVAEPLTINGGGTAAIGGIGGAYTYTAGVTGVVRNLQGNNTLSGPIAMGTAARINSDRDTLTISNNVLGAYALTIGGAGNTTISGSLGYGGLASSLTKDGAGTLTLSGANAYTGLTTVNGGVLELGASAQGRVLTGGGADLQTGKIIFDDPSQAASIAAILDASYGDGAHAFAAGNGAKIYSSTAAAAGNALGWADTGSNVTVMYTVYGDSNLDGSVNGTDLNAVLSNYNMTGAYWNQGDFNYDGTVDGADLNVVLSNYNQSLGVGAAVPEPSTLLLFGIGAIGLLSYRWMRRRG
jgi:autotransporter-associated beta strand protein